MFPSEHHIHISTHHTRSLTPHTHTHSNKPTTIIQTPWKEAWAGKRTARDLIGDKADAREVERRGLVAEEVLHGAVLFQEVRKVDERRGLGVDGKCFAIEPFRR